MTGADASAAGGECAIIGIGGPASALPALGDFFAAVPSEPGLAFVVAITPLAGSRADLVDLLNERCALPVRQVGEPTRVEPDHVYVSPADAALTVEGPLLRVARPAGIHPLDRFFVSLARARGREAVCIVAAGGGADGVLGLRAVKEHGGLALAQDPAATESDAMPRIAPVTDLVDHVLPPAEMPAVAIDHIRHVRELEERAGVEGLSPEVEAHRGRICELLRRRTGCLFWGHERGAFARRVQRRLHITRARRVADYVERLEADPGEVDRLLADLLTGVSEFFRAPAAFEALAAALPTLPGATDRERPIRVWVPGCASGEEAFSLAILLHEHLLERDRPARAQVFATDIDERGLAAARAGRFSASIAEQVSERRLARYFTQRGDGYTIDEDIRKMCIFARHDLIVEPPFARMDIVSCRNVLLCFDADVRRRLLPLLHYALAPGGLLFLGSAESADDRADLFAVQDRRARIYRARPMDRPPSCRFPIVARDEPASPAPAPAPDTRGAGFFERMLVERVAPPSVIVDAAGTILFVAGEVDRFLRRPVGAPTHELIANCPPELGVEVRTALHDAVRRHADVRHASCIAGADGLPVDVVVRQLPSGDGELWAVAFESRPDAPTAAIAGPAAPAAGDEPTGRDAEAEQRATKEQLLAALEELESVNGELERSRTQVLSIAEELQTCNEEHQAAREELQCVNEELAAINAELHDRVRQLDETSSDLQNLFASTDVAVVFVDRSLAITRFTPAATGLFHLWDSDIGRSIEDIAPRAELGDLIDEMRAVLRTLEQRERRVVSRDGATTYLMRLRPYRTVNDTVAGVVLTFVDVTAAVRLQELERRLAALAESSHDAIVGLGLDGTVTAWNAGAARLYGHPAEDAVGHPLEELIVPSARRGELGVLCERVRRGEDLADVEAEHASKSGRRLRVSLTMSPVRESRDPTGIALIARDITSRNLAQRELRRSERRYRTLASTLATVVWTAGPSGRFETRQVAWERLTGQPFAAEGERPGHGDLGFLEMFHEADRKRVVREWLDGIAGGMTFEVAGRLPSVAHGRMRHFVLRAAPVADPDGSIVEWVGEARDVHAQRERDDREHALREEVAELVRQGRLKEESLAMIAHELRNPLAPIFSGLALLDELADDPARVKQIRAVVERQARQLARTTEDLLDVYRVTRGAIRIERHPVDLVEVARNAVEAARPAIEQRGHELAIAVPAHPVVVGGDALRLEQIAANLLANAAKYTGTGGHIRLTLAADGRQAVLAVEDDGFGVSPRERDRIFELFARGGDSPSESGESLGIGLATVKRLTELHGGTVDVQSEGLGRGSTFSVRLPLLQRELKRMPEG